MSLITGPLHLARFPLPTACLLQSETTGAGTQGASLALQDRHSTTVVLRVCCPRVYANGLQGQRLKTSWRVSNKSRKTVRPFGKQYSRQLETTVSGTQGASLALHDRHSTTVVLRVCYPRVYVNDLQGKRLNTLWRVSSKTRKGSPSLWKTTFTRCVLCTPRTTLCGRLCCLKGCCQLAEAHGGSEQKQGPLLSSWGEARR